MVSGNALQARPWLSFSQVEAEGDLLGPALGKTGRWGVPGTERTAECGAATRARASPRACAGLLLISTSCTGARFAFLLVIACSSAVQAPSWQIMCRIDLLHSLTLSGLVLAVSRRLAPTAQVASAVAISHDPTCLNAISDSLSIQLWCST